MSQSIANPNGNQYVPPTSGWAILLWVIAVLAGIAALFCFANAAEKPSAYESSAAIELKNQYYMMLGVGTALAAVLFGAFGAVINELVRIRTCHEINQHVAASRERYEADTANHQG